MDKKRQTFDVSDFESVIVRDIPQQMNGSDCGMFACKVCIDVTNFVWLLSFAFRVCVGVGRF